MIFGVEKMCSKKQKCSFEFYACIRGSIVQGMFHEFFALISLGVRDFLH